MSLLNSTIVTWMVTNVAGEVIAGLIILATSVIVTYYFIERRKEVREDKKENKAKNLKEIDDLWHNLYEPIVETIEESQEKIRLKTFNPDGLENTLRKIEKDSNHELDYTLKQMMIKLFGNLPNFSERNLATFLQDIKNEIEDLKKERRKYV